MGKLEITVFIKDTEEFVGIIRLLKDITIEYPGTMDYIEHRINKIMNGKTTIQELGENYAKKTKETL